MDDFIADNYPNKPIIDTVPRTMDVLVADAASATEVGNDAIPNVSICFFMMKMSRLKISSTYYLLFP